MTCYLRTKQEREGARGSEREWSRRLTGRKEKETVKTETEQYSLDSFGPAYEEGPLFTFLASNQSTNIEHYYV